MQALMGLMYASNEQRESMLTYYKDADGLASKARYGSIMVSDSSDTESEEEIAEAMGDEVKTVTDSEKKKAEKKAKAESKKQRKAEKAAFKKAQKDAKKSGAYYEQTSKLECDVIYADAMLARSITQLALNSYVKGGINLRKTWGSYYNLLKEVENDKSGTIPKELAMNIKYGCGVFYAYLALVPAGLMRLLSAIGFISDKELGEEYLTEVLQSGTIRAPWAGLILLTLYLFLPTGLGNVDETLKKTKDILDYMNEQFPNNCYFWSYLNFYHRKRGETKEAVEAVNKALDNCKAANRVPLLMKYVRADTLYMDLQFTDARKAYKSVLDSLDETGETFAYTGQVCLSLAACYVMLGDFDSAFQWVKRVQSMYNPKSKNDANSPKFAARVIYEPRLLPLIGVYILYINRDLAHMQPTKVVELNKCMDQVMDGKDLTNPEVKGMYLLFQGVMHRCKKEDDEARTVLGQVLDLEKKMGSDTVVLPYAYYEFGEMEYRSGNLLEAKKRFEKGMSLRGDGHETLANRYTIAMKQLRAELKEKA